jgi:riboflavin biosynthesis pyrimidine reductase
MLRRLHEASGPIDLLDMVFAEDRSTDDGPWVMFNMVASVDGATAVQGGSSALNDDDDKALFAALRAVPDVILVGAGTVRAENYGPVALDEQRRARRVEHGMSPAPRLAIATASLSLEPEMRVFEDPEHRPLIITGKDVATDRIESFADRADVVQLADLDAASILDSLGESAVVLCEGGPTLNGQLIADGFIHEMNLTIAPMMAVGESHRIAHGEDLLPPADMTLARTLVGDRALFLRYVRAG